MGTFIASVYLLSGMSAATAIVILASFLGADLFIEMLRLRVPAFNEKVMRSWGFLMRASEVNRISGVPYYLGATMLAIAIFPSTVAILAILYLAWGDPVASLMGIPLRQEGSAADAGPFSSRNGFGSHYVRHLDRVVFDLPVASLGPPSRRSS